MHTFSSGEGRPLIDEGWSAVREDHDVILEWLSMEGYPKNIRDKRGGCHMEVVPQM